VSPRAGLWLALLLPLSAAADAPSEETLLGCRRIEAAEQRLACYDRVVDRVSGTLAPEAASTEPQAASSPAPASEAPADERPLRERLFGRSKSESERTLRKSYGLEETPGEISAAVTEARRGPDKLWTIALDNGQTWRQTEAVTFSFRVGDSVEIEAGLAGSYYLRRNGAGRTIRVKRIQ
jgi:hypothetical protein